MNAGALLQQAIALENRGDLAGAASGYRNVLAREPGNVEALFLLGRAYCQQGRFDDAADRLSKAVSLNPGHASAHSLLGVALKRLGRPQDALVCFDCALTIDPRLEPALISKADALDALGRPAEALAVYDRTLQVNGRNLVAWCNRGTALEALGRDNEAAESFKRALALNPNVPEVHFNLANVLLRMERHEDAVRQYRQAVALRPNLALAFANLGRALAKLGRWQEAADSYAQALRFGLSSAQLHDALSSAFWQLQRYQNSLASADDALAIDPNHVAALSRKGQVLLMLGRMDEARTALERAAAIDPSNSNSYLTLGILRRFAVGDPELAAMEKLLADIDSRSEDDQIKLHFALGKAYGDIGLHAQAFHHLQHGNALKRRQIDYDEAAAIGSLDRIATVLTPDLMRAKSGLGNLSSQPVFVVGMPRSGTTLIEQILASHPQIYGAGERKDFRKAMDKVTDGAAYPNFVPTLGLADLGALGAAYLAGIGDDVKDLPRFTDKLPANFIYLGLIRLALPNARIIHVFRNPIDTCLSCFSILFHEKLNYTYDLGELARYYRAYERLMAHWRLALPEGAMLEVRYEDVVADIEAQSRRIVDYCGLPWNDACLAFHKADRLVATASMAQVRQPIYRSSVGRWRTYQDELKPLLEALGEPAP